jgi:uncharacterized membrane protein
MIPLLHTLIPLASIFLTIILVDGLWLYVQYAFHKSLIENIQNTPLEVRYFPAVVLYILVTLAVYYFAVRESKAIREAALRGAFLGLSMYGLYDLTNFATFTNYSLSMTVIDMVWGTFLCGTSASVGYFVKQRREERFVTLS